MSNMLDTSDLHDKEQAKYNRVWQVPDYHNHSPALSALPRIIKALELENLPVFEQGAVKLLDAGCGSARAAAELARRAPVMMHCVDISLLSAMSNIPPNQVGRQITNPVMWFYQQPLDMLPSISGGKLECDRGYCIDVMEHIPTALVQATLRAISETVSGKMYFEIAGYIDHFGPAILGEPLHLTIMDLNAWMCAMFRNWDQVSGEPLPGGHTYAITCKQPKRYRYITTL